MKKVFITLGVLILVVITALMVIPTFFKGDILQIIEKQSAKYINAEIENRRYEPEHVHKFS